MQETQESRVWPLGREDPLEEGLATHSTIFAWRIPCREEAWRTTNPSGYEESNTIEVT